MNQLKNNDHKWWTVYEWLTVYESLGNLSKSIRTENKEDISKEISTLLSFLLHISSKYNIDMNDAWALWYSKASSKIYQSSM